ncbi:F-box domain, cyclin-like protein [Metarhizium album ARSEF 1941]|uniref:F-box domain, cyclin-like protein n=1 Tax=Metarhizium album (strain ARSEF 1941) TaxID=1081103 RepID=A0A0B2WU52_METAS|nr:F-box domain, cyclin-like protein [Metarhizium album ARSEF 1941]KHN96997.1 F-box domain, cyclin-like protein [Metarhizium album ARSEF 1941]
MDSLPSELLHEILSHLPPSARPSTRLTSRLFNAILAPRSFPSVPSFIDPDVALSKLESGAREARRRQKTSIWSPGCVVPCHLPIPQSFLLAVYVAFRGRQWQPCVARMRGTCRECGSDGEIGLSEGCVGRRFEELTVDSVVQSLQREDVTEESLRVAMFRYALYLSYSYQGSEEAPSLWVFHENVWASKK